MANGSKPQTSEAKRIEEAIENLHRQGLDPSRVVSCVPSAGLPGSVPGVRGCNVYDRCPFGRKDYGAFKGLGPKNVGYYHKPNDGTTHQVENFLACDTFVRLFRSRINAAQQAVNEGPWKMGDNPGPEVIQIVAQEGETIRVKVNVPVDEKQGWNKNAPYKWERKEVVVPKYSHPEILQGDSYEAELERDRIVRQTADDAGEMPEMPSRPQRLELDDEEVKPKGK